MSLKPGYAVGDCHACGLPSVHGTLGPPQAEQIMLTAGPMAREMFERGGDPKVCVPKMARQDFPCSQCRVFPQWSLWSGGAGGGVTPPPPAVCVLLGPGHFSNGSLGGGQVTWAQPTLMPCRSYASCATWTRRYSACVSGSCCVSICIVERCDSRALAFCRRRSISRRRDRW